MADRVDLEYNVQVTGLEEAAASANAATESANLASTALQGARTQSGGTLATLSLTLRSLNSTRLAVAQTSRAINEMNPAALLTGFMSMLQVVNNLTSLTRRLKESTAAASAAQAILTALSGHWWLIPLAIAAGALVYSRIQSMQTGGPVSRTGLYLLHRGEEVVPGNSVNYPKSEGYEALLRPIIHSSRTETTSRHVSYGPIFVTFEKQPEEGKELDRWLRELGPMIVQQARR